MLNVIFMFGVLMESVFVEEGILVMVFCVKEVGLCFLMKMRSFLLLIDEY